jgi:predicted Zn-dependent protease
MNEFEQDEFERELTRALQRVDAPEGLAVRIMERAAGPAAAKVVPIRRWPVVQQRWFGGALAAALALGVFAGEQLHRRHKQELADQQFATAVRITDQALDQTRAQLLRAGIQISQ